jgi:hypothetical protein
MCLEFFLFVKDNGSYKEKNVLQLIDDGQAIRLAVGFFEEEVTVEQIYWQHQLHVGD